MTDLAPPSRRYAETPSLAELNRERSHDADIEQDLCLACGSHRLAPFARVRGIGYHRCRCCGFVFVNPTPTDAALSRFYNSAFYSNYRLLEEEVIARRPYYSISAYRDLRELASWISADKSAAVLDFGCGPGSFLALLRDEFGYKNLKGLEISSRGAEFARRRYGLSIERDIRALQGSLYDVIVMLETIEHLPHPDDAIRECSSLLKPGGVMLITTPSVRNPTARFFPSYCLHYTGPSHISMFTEAALEAVLAKHHMTIERLEIDASANVFGAWLASPFYRLDFLSPRDSTDTDDRLFTPTPLGRALGLRPTRAPGRVLDAALHYDALLGRLWRKVSGRVYSDHLYVLARRSPECLCF